MRPPCHPAAQYPNGTVVPGPSGPPARDCPVSCCGRIVDFGVGYVIINDWSYIAAINFTCSSGLRVRDIILDVDNVTYVNVPGAPVEGGFIGVTINQVTDALTGALRAGRWHGKLFHTVRRVATEQRSAAPEQGGSAAVAGAGRGAPLWQVAERPWLSVRAALPPNPPPAGLPAFDGFLGNGNNTNPAQLTCTRSDYVIVDAWVGNYPPFGPDRGMWPAANTLSIGCGLPNECPKGPTGSTNLTFAPVAKGNQVALWNASYGEVKRCPACLPWRWSQRPSRSPGCCRACHLCAAACSLGLRPGCTCGDGLAFPRADCADDPPRRPCRRQRGPRLCL